MCLPAGSRNTKLPMQFTHSSSLIQSGYQFPSICASKAKAMNKCIGTILDVTPCLDLARDCTSSPHSATGQTGLLKIVLIADQHSYLRNNALARIITSKLETQQNNLDSTILLITKYFVSLHKILIFGKDLQNFSAFCVIPFIAISVLSTVFDKSHNKKVPGPLDPHPPVNRKPLASEDGETKINFLIFFFVNIYIYRYMFC